MPNSSRPAPLVSTRGLAFVAGASVLVLSALFVVGWYVNPDRAAGWILRLCLLPGIWGLLEFLSAADTTTEWGEERIRYYRIVVAVGGVILALEIGPALALYGELIDAAFFDFTRRVRGVLFGFALAIWGNRLPRFISPWPLESEPFDWQGVHRFVGWVASLGGVAIVVVWFVLPAGEAVPVQRLILTGVVGLALGRKLGSVVRYSLRGDHQGNPAETSAGRSP